MLDSHKNKKKHPHQHNLTGEHPNSDTGQVLLALGFFTIWIADTFFLKASTFLNNHVSIFIRTASGIFFLCLAIYLAIAGLSAMFGEMQDKPEVVRKSVFNFVRHPVYLSEILLYLGFLMLSMSLLAAAVWIISILFLDYIARHEERLLLERFGEAYGQYMKDVPMWIPRLWKIKPADS